MNLVALLFCLSAWSAPADPKAVVEEIFVKAAAPEIASDAIMQSEVNSKVDFDALAKAALGREAKALPRKEYTWFRDTLKEIITRTVYPKAPDFLKGVKISYSDVKEQGKKARVASSVQNKADLTDVEYKMERAADGSWKVVDVSISGLSWVDSINDQVRDVVKKKKWKGLKDAMNKKLAELKGGTSP